jgi:hypothetical protein
MRSRFILDRRPGRVKRRSGGLRTTLRLPTASRESPPQTARADAGRPPRVGSQQSFIRSASRPADPLPAQATATFPSRSRKRGWGSSWLLPVPVWVESALESKPEPPRPI